MIRSFLTIFGFSICGALMGVGLLAPAAAVVGLLGLLGFFYWLSREETSSVLVVGVVLAWWCRYLVALVWYWDTYPLGWVDIGGVMTQLGVIFFYWTTSAAWLAVGGVVFVYGYKKYIQNTTASWCAAAVAVLWVVSEIVGAIAFSFFTYGSGGTVTAAFSFGMVGYVTAMLPGGMSLAAVAGVYGLGFLIVYAVVILIAYVRGTMTVKVLLSFCLVVASMGVYGYYREKIPFTETVVTIDTSVSAQTQRSEGGEERKLAVLQEAVSMAMAVDAVAIILPEEARYFGLLGDGEYEVGVRLHRFGAGTSTASIIDSARTDVLNGAVLRAYEFDPIENDVTTADKRYLVPQGEFVPWLYGSVFRVFGYGSVVDEMKESLYVRGGSSETNIPVLFCFESVNPIAVQQMRVAESSFIAHPISHAWFHSPQTLWNQLDTMLLVQARWSGVSIVSAGNMVTGKRYTENGTIDTGTVVASGDGWVVKKFGN